MAGKIMTDLSLRISANTAELKKGLSRAKKEVSSFKKSLSGIKSVIASAFAIGAIIQTTKAIFSFSQEIGKAIQKVRSLTGLAGSDLTNFTAKLKAVSDVYEKDFNKTLKTANVLSKQFKITQQEAVDLIQKGFSTGADGEELLEQITEYSVQFKQAGYEGSEMLAIMSQGLKSGSWSDKLPDVIKEGSISLSEMTTATKDALKGIGLSGDVISTQLTNGTISMQDAIKTVTGKMAELPNNSKEYSTAVADIFRGAGEDLGREMLTSLATIDTTLDNIIDKTSDVVIAKNNMVESSTRLNTIWVKLFGESSVGWLKIKSAVVDLTSNGLQIVVNKFNEVMLGIKNTWATVKFFFSLMLNTFKSTGKVLAYVFNPKNWGKGFAEGLKTLVVKGMEDVNKNIDDYGKIIAKNTKESIEKNINNNPIKLVNDDDAKKQGKDSGKKFGEGFEEGKPLSDKDKLKAKQLKDLENNIISAEISSVEFKNSLNELLSVKGEDNDWAEALGFGSKAIEKLREFERVSKSVDSIVNTIGAPTEEQADVYEGDDDTLARLKSRNSEIQSITESTATLLKATIMNGLVTMGEGIGQMAVSGMDGMEGFLNSFINLVLDFGAQFGKLLIGLGVAKISLEKIGISGIGAVIAGTALVALTSATKGLLKKGAGTENVKGFATGVNNFEGGLAMIGERGPELVNLPRGSNVHSNGDTKRLFNNNNSQFSNVRFEIEADKLVGILTGQGNKQLAF